LRIAQLFLAILHPISFAALPARRSWVRFRAALIDLNTARYLTLPAPTCMGVELVAGVAGTIEAGDVAVRDTKSSSYI
jgi:hypothetical protein